MEAFLLDKWYFDAVDAEGRAAVVHAAVLRLGPIHLHYGAILAMTGRVEVVGGEVAGGGGADGNGVDGGGLRGRAGAVHRATIRAGDMPITSSRGTSWMCGSLDLSVACTPLGAHAHHTHTNDTHAHETRPLPPPHCLLDREDGVVEWGPIHRRAMVEVRAPGVLVRGPGYAERLTMTLRPWDLPINVMHWGRWIGELSSMVWLRWEGPEPRTLVLLEDGGVEGVDEAVASRGACVGASVGAGVVRAGGASLGLSRVRTLRDESLGDSLVSIIPGLRSWTPARMLAARERRWLSVGRLTRADGRTEQGWVIHEEVRFDGSAADAASDPAGASEP